MSQSKHPAICACGEKHPSRPRAAREGWQRTGTRSKAVWTCPKCVALVNKSLRLKGQQPEPRPTGMPRRRSGLSPLLAALALASLSVPTGESDDQ